MKRILFLMLAISYGVAFSGEKFSYDIKDGENKGVWECEFKKGGKDAINKSKEKLEEALNRGDSTYKNADGKGTPIKKVCKKISESTTQEEPQSSSSAGASSSSVETSDSSVASSASVEKNEPKAGKSLLQERAVEIAVIVGLFLVFLLFIIKILSGISKLKEENRMLNGKIDEAITKKQMEEALRVLYNKEKQYQSKIESLENQVVYLKKRLEQIEAFRGNDIGASLERAEPLPKAKRDIFYLPSPTGNSFNASKASLNFEETVSLYRFEKIPGENKAIVFVENKPSVVQRFTGSPESQDGVCEEVSGFNQNASDIETIEPGEAVLEGEKWRMVKKVRISYS